MWKMKLKQNITHEESVKSEACSMPDSLFQPRLYLFLSPTGRFWAEMEAARGSGWEEGELTEARRTGRADGERRRRTWTGWFYGSD